MANTHSLDLELSSSQYAYITDASQTGLDITGDITIEAWIKLEQLPSTAGSIFVITGKGDWGNAVNTRAYYFAINTSNKLFFSFSSDGGNSNVAGTSSDSTSLFTAGVWHHVAVTLDASASSMELYVDGVNVADTESGSITSIYNSNNDFFVGSRKANGTYTDFFDGLIDEVRVWNDIRTSGEISANYDSELVGNESGLVGYWKLNNNYLDETSNNNDLSASGSPVFSTDVPFSATTTSTTTTTSTSTSTSSTSSSTSTTTTTSTSTSSSTSTSTSSSTITSTSTSSSTSTTTTIQVDFIPSMDRISARLVI